MAAGVGPAIGPGDVGGAGRVREQPADAGPAVPPVRAARRPGAHAAGGPGVDGSRAAGRLRPAAARRRPGGGGGRRAVRLGDAAAGGPGGRAAVLRPAARRHGVGRGDATCRVVADPVARPDDRPDRLRALRGAGVRRPLFRHNWRRAADVAAGHNAVPLPVRPKHPAGPGGPVDGAGGRAGGDAGDGAVPARPARRPRRGDVGRAARLEVDPGDGRRPRARGRGPGPGRRLRPRRPGGLAEPRRVGRFAGGGVARRRAVRANRLLRRGSAGADRPATPSPPCPAWPRSPRWWRRA